MILQLQIPVTFHYCSIFGACLMFYEELDGKVGQFCLVHPVERDTGQGHVTRCSELKRAGVYNKREAALAEPCCYRCWQKKNNKAAGRLISVSQWFPPISTSSTSLFMFQICSFELILNWMLFKSSQLYKSGKWIFFPTRIHCRDSRTVNI